jgi:hybrid polyketide synthase/nonribosomal peptide synthetase ACE1
MAGELGQSLAGWMIAHGARFIVLTSRSPKVNPLFVEEMSARYGAVVKAVSLDITSPESLRSVHASMTAALPPIAGVVNGAMILDDELFANMTHEQFMRVTNPKVLGTCLLDEAFHDTELDFFVVASSIASVIGWSGQSNYSAANEFMTSLVNKRRKRGVAGSAMNIPAVLGVGYAAHSDTFDFDYFQSLGYINISEQDLHILFAEAILSGRPDSNNTEPQVAMGINYIAPDLYVKESHRRDAKFSHFIASEEAGSEVRAVETSVRVRVQLQTAPNADAAYAIIRDAFMAHLKRMLRMTEDQKFDESVALVEQGVDSLVAVDIRAWFLKELEADVPTLKVMGGGSVSVLVKTALAKMPAREDVGALEVVAPAKAEPPLSSIKSNTVVSRPAPDQATVISAAVSTGSPVFTLAQTTTTPSMSDGESRRTPSPSRDDFGKSGINIVIDELNISLEEGEAESVAI